MLSYKITFHTVIALIVVLVLVFLFLLGYTLWTRMKKQYWQQYKQKFRNRFSSSLFDFIEGDAEAEEAEKLIKRLSKYGRDITFFLELLDEMRDLLKGDERRKLNVLIEHKIFYDYYWAGLFSLSTKKQLKACLYFEKISELGSRVSARLVSISKSQSLKLAYVATKALQSSIESVVRRNALLRFFKRDDVSELMTSEVLTSFYRDGKIDRKEISKGLKKILAESEIAPKKKKLIVLFLANKNFYEDADFLLQHLKNLQYRPANAPLISGLIEALGNLQVDEASLYIRDFLEIDDQELQLQCVKALGKLGGKEDLAYLLQQLLKVGFTVRKGIIETLAKNKGGVILLSDFLVANQQIIGSFKSEKKSHNRLPASIHKVYNTATGIRIMLAPENRISISNV